MDRAALCSVALSANAPEIAESVDVVYVQGEYVRVTEVLKARRGARQIAQSWKSVHDLPSGRLRLQAYSPYPGTDWSKRWDESSTGEFEGLIQASWTSSSEQPRRLRSSMPLQ